MDLPTPDPAFRWTVETWGYALRCVPLESVAQHLFTTKQLQLRASSLAPEKVERAWTEAAACLGARAEQIRRVKQVHGCGVRVVGSPVTRTASSRHAVQPRSQTVSHEMRQLQEADALISNEPGQVLAVQVADCVPLLMADRSTGAVGAVHAGWRGTLARIAAVAVESMSREFGTRPEDLTVALGPSIGACCYSVGVEVREAFRAAGATTDDLSRWFDSSADGLLRLDLWTANFDQLRAVGVTPDRIHIARLCTQTYAHIFESFRAEGSRVGRMAAMVRVPEGR